MAARALTRRYDGVAQAFYWAVVLLVIIQYATKWLSPAELSFATKQGLNAWHLGIGPAILLLMLARLAWRLTHTPPSAPDDIPLALQFISRCTHLGKIARWLKWLAMLTAHYLVSTGRRNASVT